jgi:lipoyl(octanoyl) transferase
MNLYSPLSEANRFPDSALRVFLLGNVDFEAALSLQRALAYQVAGDRDGGALILCEHPPLITVGRQGRPTDLRCEPAELQARRWPVRWVNRGGGCLLHLPGQFAIYPILALDRRGLGVRTYLERLQQVMIAVLDDFSVRAEARPGEAGVWVGPRLIAGVGAAVRDWVAYFGAWLNVNPDLTPFRMVQTGGPDDGPMTSLERERRAPLRPSLVRERLIEHFLTVFPFSRHALFFDHPLLKRRKPLDLIKAGS